MNDKNMKRTLAVIAVIIIVISAITAGLLLNTDIVEEDSKEKTTEKLPPGVKLIEKKYSFSDPIIESDYEKERSVVKVKEADFHMVCDQKPVLPVNLTKFRFPLGTKILDLEYEYSEVETESISYMLSYGSCSTATEESERIYRSGEMYPSDFVTYHTGGGLIENEHKTFLNVRIYPVTYTPMKDQIHSVENVTVKIKYKLPETPMLEDRDEKDLLILSPEEYSENLQPLVEHKEEIGIRTKLATLEEIDGNTPGIDAAEQVKYYIKESIEDLGVKYVLLVGGRKAKTSEWMFPVRYSHVVIREGTQELVEPKFLSDLYFADIYNSEGNFSSWDSNHNQIYAEYKDGKWKDEVDLYPDVRLGRLPCRNTKELNIIVDKIINYENMEKGDWFDRMVMVSGDHWDDPDSIDEGSRIVEETSGIMSDFEPVKILAQKEKTLTVRDINKEINKGAGFLYFCGHGGPTLWGIHYPPDASGWGPSLFRFIRKDGLLPLNYYYAFYFNFLRNKDKLPVTVVGGCYNAQFDIYQDKKILPVKDCWAWKLASHKRGGSIATIANTALGTHSMGDADYDGVNDYVETLDGWLEMKFFKLYSNENKNVLGQLHQESMTHYLNQFLGNNDEMDPKMVQQWVLFGDPSLRIKDVT
ncbi:MAG: C25 family cysteine peptidase [Candidatus Thermoplasmatota archaeon]